MSEHQLDDRRSRLIATLWALKIAIEKSGDRAVQFIHFPSLLRDEVYRLELIERARAHQSAEIRSLAEQAAALNISGTTVHSRSVKPETAPSTETMRRPEPPAQDAEQGPHREREKRFTKGRLQYVALVMVVASVVLMGLNASRLEQLVSGNDVEISGALYGNQVWDREHVYHLKGLVFVESGAVLNIEPGTLVVGHPGSALIVTRDGSINARGNREAPIVFTSALAPGYRGRGDWGGVVLLGNAPVNTGTGHIEGVAHDDPRGAFGGADAMSNCGILQYVRIEFAGHEIAKDNELNGLTLGGCGSGTVLRYVQVHMGLDDGIEFFGGTAALQYAVISRPGDDGLDWDRGWQGKGQFIIVQMGDEAGDNAIEADNYKKDHNAEPRSHPTLSNLTLVGSQSRKRAQRGMTLRRGTGGDLRNILVSGFSLEAIDIRDRTTAAGIEKGRLRFAGVLFTTPPFGGRYFGEESGEGDDDGGFDERRFFETLGKGVRFATVPVLPNGTYDASLPRFVPPAILGAETESAPVPEGELWDEAANFIGAVRPGSRNTWLDGWTAFPND